MLRSIAIVASAITLCYSMAGTALHAADEDLPELAYGDLRLSGGAYANHWYDANLAIVAGNIGEKDPHATDAWADLGIVVGLQVSTARVPLSLVNDQSYKARLSGAMLLLGLGMYLDEEDHMEFLVGYGYGRASDATVSSFGSVGTYTSYEGQVGYYHTIAQHYQVGAYLGYVLDKVKLRGNPGSFTDNAQGVILNASIGYRF